MKSAKKAPETGNLDYVPIWIPRESEKEPKGVFEKILRARRMHGKLLITGSSRPQMGPDRDIPVTSVKYPAMKGQ